eukprot:2478076-Alexandrium_andersonii.AAC.1
MLAQARVSGPGASRQQPCAAFPSSSRTMWARRARKGVLPRGASWSVARWLRPSWPAKRRRARATSPRTCRMGRRGSPAS